MLPYELMAIVYDDLTDDIDYDEWYDHVKHQLDELKLNAYKVLEIGSGTGNMTRRLVDDGLHVTVVEPSEAMLSVLQEKMVDVMGKMQFFNGPIQSFITKQRFDVCMAFLDVVNYIAPDQLEFFFSRIHQQLNKDGVFILDWSTPFKLKEVLGQHTFSENHDDFAYIWENDYVEDDKILYFDFVMFTELENGTFERHIESHQQFAHDLDTIIMYASKYFKVEAVYGDHHKTLGEQDHRVHLYLRVLEDK
jgi:SAM-dependent methyltransferase